MTAPMARRRLSPLLLLALCGPLAGPAPSRAAEADTTTTLAASTAAPWNPPGIVTASEPWEAVVRFPGRLVSLPLAGLGQAIRLSLLRAENDFTVQRIAWQFRQVSIPVSVQPAGLGDHTGFGGRLAYGQQVAGAHLRAAFEASTGGYVRWRGDARLGLLDLGYNMDRRPSDRYFGRGMEARKEDRSRYGLIEQRLDAGLTLRSDVRHDGRERSGLRLWAGPRWSRLTQGWASDDPSIADRFPALYAARIDREIEHFTYGARLSVDQRDGQPHWTHGWQSNVAVERFDRPLAASPSRTGAQFTRVAWNAEAGVSVGRDPRTLRLSMILVNDQVGAGAERMLPEDEARLGGGAGLAGYEARRFHDLDALNVRLAYIFPLAHFVEMNLHVDNGGVFAHVIDDARWNRLRQSAGIAVRARSTRAVIGSFGVDFSPETTRLVFSLLVDS